MGPLIKLNENRIDKQTKRQKNAKSLVLRLSGTHLACNRDMRSKKK